LANSHFNVFPISYAAILIECHGQEEEEEWGGTKKNASVMVSRKGRDARGRTPEAWGSGRKTKSATSASKKARSNVNCFRTVAPFARHGLLHLGLLQLITPLHTATGNCESVVETGWVERRWSSVPSVDRSGESTSRPRVARVSIRCSCRANGRYIACGASSNSVPSLPTISVLSARSHSTTAQPSTTRKSSTTHFTCA
jgi:hypothetical protein